MAWNIWAGIGAISAGISVILGAFGAHALKNRMPAEDLLIFETGVRYQMYHAFAIIACALIATRFESFGIKLAAWFFLTGTIIFSGSLYTLTLTGQRQLGMVTPIGGVLFVVGWFALAWATLSR